MQNLHFNINVNFFSSKKIQQNPEKILKLTHGMQSDTFFLRSIKFYFFEAMRNTELSWNKKYTNFTFDIF